MRKNAGSRSRWGGWAGGVSLLVAVVLVWAGLQAPVFHGQSILDMTMRAPFGYEVKGTGVVASSRHAFWIDNRRVIFMGTDTYAAGSSDKSEMPKKARIYIWDVAEDKLDIYKEIPNKSMTYSGGNLFYSIKREKHGDKSYLHYFGGPLGKEKNKTILTYGGGVDGTERQLNKYTAKFVQRPAFIGPGTGWEKLRPGHGYIVYKRKAEPDGTVAMLHSDRFESPRPIRLDPRNNLLSSATWHDFEGGYFVPSTLNGVTNTRQRWKDDNCLPVWWLYPDAEVRETCIPWGVWGKHGPDNMRPVKGGFFMSVRTDPDSVSGAYVIKNGRGEKVVGGMPGRPKVSPDGCRVVFSHAEHLPPWKATEVNLPALKMVDLCVDR